MTETSLLTLLQGAGSTLMLAILALAVGIPLGLGLALVRWQGIPVLDKLVAAYVSLMRPTPVVTLCLLIFFLLPTIGLDLPPIAAAVLTLCLNTTAFTCEIWRAALATIPKEQLEAAQAYGFSRFKGFTRIVMPQLWRASVAPIVSEITLLIKITPAVSVIGIVDLTRAASRVGAQTYDPLPPFLVATVMYAVMIALLVQLQHFVERRLEQRYGSRV